MRHINGVRKLLELLRKKIIIIIQRHKQYVIKLASLPGYRAAGNVSQQSAVMRDKLQQS